MKVKVFYRVLDRVFEVPDEFRFLENTDNYDEERYDDLVDKLVDYVAEKIDDKADISIDCIYNEDDEPIYEE